jgi:hypothetical protein
MEMMRVPSSRGEWAMTTSRPASKPNSDKPFFPVLETVVFERDARPGKHVYNILEAEAVLDAIFPVLGFVPFVFHFRM